MVQRERCPNCNGELESIGGGQFRCKACRTVFDETTTTDEEKLLLTAAAKLLRDGEFDTADSSYRDIISSHPKNYEAYFGRALCKHGIIFVNDITENKMVPTCYITDVGSFLDDSNYKRAVEFAPDVVKEQYIEQGNKIENIINEWKEKASKQHYDIFISFKDSENGKRTEDSVEAQNLYTHLIQLGYKVFFSRETLRELVSERYEPYIFNAINVAPIMIVYGQKGEYLESTWVRNEWSRFIKKIQSGEKDKAGLIVCYENMDASELPFEFKAIQCMDASRKEFYGDLEAHIKKVLDKVRKPNSEIDTIQTEYGKVGKKAAKLNYSEIKMNVLGTSQIEKVTETDEFILNSAKKYFDRGLYSDCEEKLLQFLEHNEYNYEANLLKVLIEGQCKTIEDYIKHIRNSKMANKVKYLTTLTNKEEALKIIELLYNQVINCFKNNSKEWKPIFYVLYDQDFPENKELRYAAVNHIINSNNERSDENFDEFIKFIDNNDIDFHIKARLQMISKSFEKKNNYPITARKYIEEIQEIDEGNAENLKYKMLDDLQVTNNEEAISAAIENDKVFFEDLEQILKFSSESSGVKELSSFVSLTIKALESQSEKEKSARIIALFDKLVRYFPVKCKKEIAASLKMICDCLYRQNYFEGCIEYANKLINYCEKKDKAEIIYLVLLCRARVPNYAKDNSIRFASQKINSYNEWNILLSLEDEKVETQLFDLYDLQEKEDKHQKEIGDNREKGIKKLNAKKNGLLAKDKKEKRKRNVYYAIATTITLLIVLSALAALAYAFYLFNIRHEKGMRIFINLLTPVVLFFFASSLFSLKGNIEAARKKKSIDKETIVEKIANKTAGITIALGIFALLFQFIYAIFLKNKFILPKNATSNMFIGIFNVILIMGIILFPSFCAIDSHCREMESKFSGKVTPVLDMINNIDKYFENIEKTREYFDKLTEEFVEISSLKNNQERANEDVTNE